MTVADFPNLDTTKALMAARMTIVEAQHRWCPFARVWRAGEVSVNRAVNGEPAAGTRCIADRCMAWRWAWAGELSTTDGDCGIKV